METVRGCSQELLVDGEPALVEVAELLLRLGPWVVSCALSFMCILKDFYEC